MRRSPTGGRLHARAIAIEQAGTEVALEGLQAARESGLGQRECFRGPGEVAVIDRSPARAGAAAVPFS